MIPGKEFETQVFKHAEKIYEHFGVRPVVFRNTELIYQNEIGKRISKFGFKGIIADGLERVLHQRSANHVFTHPEDDNLKILLRNYRLSDDIGFRFNHEGETLTPEKYISWLKNLPKTEEVVTLALDYETFGEHQKKETGIFRFLEGLFTSLANDKTFRMLTPCEAIDNLEAHSPLDAPQFISWADTERDLSAWLENEMQRDAFDSLLKMEYEVKSLEDEAVLDQWRSLQTSDHFYYMSTKKGSDGAVHNYFSPYRSPYEAFINYMNVITDLSMKLQVFSAAKTAHEKAVQDIVQEEELSQAMGSRMTMLAVQ